MFKDYGKYLLTSLKVYLFVLVIIFILKIVGLDYFGLDINNPIINNIENFLDKTNLIYIFDFITLYIMFYVCFSIICKNKKMKKISLISTIIEFLLQFLLLKINKIELKSLVDMFLIIIGSSFGSKKIQIKKSVIIIFMIVLYQLISYSIRGEKVIANYDCKVMDILFNIDQYIMLIITYKIYFMEGDIKICHQEVYSFLQRLTNLRELQKKLQRKLHNFKKENKETKITIIIYSILYFIWNIFTLAILLFVAKLNDTFIECLFIVTSFWLSKRAFGKAFHLSSMTQCFIVSNLTYYALNRITTPLGISILIPILLGVGLSYVTSKFVKKLYKPLYKGMPKDLFEETILKVVDKDSIKYKICYDYFIEKKSALSLSYKYNYSEAGIRKIKDRINNKIKELN